MSTFSLGTCELSSNAKNNLWHSMAAEFVGVFILNLFPNAACTHAKGDVLVSSLAFGLSVFALIAALGHVSGCHINPVVTISFLAIGKVSVIRALFYLVAQFSAAIAAVLTLQFLVHGVPEADQTLGHSFLNENLSPLQGFTFEFFLGFLLLFTICAVCDDKRPESRFTAPLVVGCSVLVGKIAFTPYSSASISPSGSFATALVLGLWENQWIYWAGPILGGLAGTFIYTHLFAATLKVEICERSCHDVETTQK